MQFVLSEYPAGFRALPPGVQFIILSALPIFFVFGLILLCRLIACLTLKRRTQGIIYKFNIPRTNPVARPASSASARPRQSNCTIVSIIEVDEPEDEAPPPPYSEIFPTAVGIPSSSPTNKESKPK